MPGPAVKRALLTGGTGFIGANLARRLLDDGHDVHLLLRPGHASWRIEEIRARVTVHEADLAEPSGLDATVARIRPDWVFHLAAHGAYSWQTDLERILRTNFLGTVHLVQACVKAGFEGFVHAGSSSEYGLKDHAPAETELLEPNSPYAVAKAAATHFCRLAARERGLSIVTLRLYSVYGPFEEPARLVPTLIVHGLRGDLPPLVAPSVARDFVHVDDAVEAFVRAASRPHQQPGAVYNVGTGLQTTLREVAEHARAVLPICAAPGWGTMEKRSWDTSVWVSDPRLIREKLGWKPALSFPEGLRATVEWLKARPDLLRYYESRVLRSC